MPDNPELIRPVDVADRLDTEPRWATGSDITLRDVFAGMVMQGNMAAGPTEGMDLVAAAYFAYEAADCMIAEREKRGGE